MKTTQQSIVGLAQAKTTELADSLNTLLASYAVHYQNLRGFHWNISGPGFFELHVKFEELYVTANASIDAIAERVLTLEQRPLHTYESYLERSHIQPSSDLSSANETVSATAEGIQALLQLERALLELAEKSGDEGTAALMSDYIKEQEKTLWMLRAYLA